MGFVLSLCIAVVSTIPKIVCETLAALGLQEEIPSWKIMDNKGKITVVLHWEKEHPPGQPPSLQVAEYTLKNLLYHITKMAYQHIRLTWLIGYLYYY